MPEPPTEYRVELDCYSGPLDLLLYLVKRDEIDLHDIPIARLTEQYLQHLELIKQIDINLAGEFLVMAATLLEIKSAMLVPRAEGDASLLGAASEGDSAGEGVDPRYELVQQLLAYKRFKDAATELDQRRITWESRFPAVPLRAERAGTVSSGDAGEEELGAAELELDLEDVSVMDLCDAFARILASVGQAPAKHAVTYDDTPISLHAADIADRLQREGPMTLQAIFVGRASRGEMIGLFLATLELVRQKKVKVYQDAVGGEIKLELRPDAEQLQPTDDAASDWRDPETGEVQYDWPSEEARQRAERRARLRLSRLEKLKAGGPAALNEQGEEEEPPIVDLDDDNDDDDDEIDAEDEGGEAEDEADR